MRATDAASSAVRNLNDHEIMGRKLRVDYSNDNAEDDSTMVRFDTQGLTRHTNSGCSPISQTINFLHHQ